MAWFKSQTHPHKMPPPCTLIKIGKEKNSQIEIVLLVEGKKNTFLVDAFPNGGISLPGKLEDIITASLPRSKHFGEILERVIEELPIEFPILLSDPEISED